MSERRMNRTDMITGLIVTSLGLFAFIESWRMPRFEARGADPYTVPGLTPGLVGAVITVLGVVLLLRAFRGFGPVGDAAPTITQWDRSSALRTVFTVVGVGIYAFLLFGRMHFILATDLFIFVFTCGAELINADRKRSVPMTMLAALILALCASFAIHYVFTSIFLVRMPG